MVKFEFYLILKSCINNSEVNTPPIEKNHLKMPCHIFPYSVASDFYLEKKSQLG
jgi:hypothetical protein